MLISFYYLKLLQIPCIGKVSPLSNFQSEQEDKVNCKGIDMTFSAESEKIVDAFVKFVSTNDKSLIEKFTVDEIKRAMIEFNHKKNLPFYKAMEIRANDLDAEERLYRTKKEKRKDIVFGIVIGVIATVIGGVILWYILPKKAH